MVLLGAAAEKRKFEQYKHFIQAAPATRFIPFVVEANGRFAVEVQKLLIELSSAITRMDMRLEECSEDFKLAAGKEKHFWMRKL
jgi:hypothetical protein